MALPLAGLEVAASRIGSLIDDDGSTHLADYSYLGVSSIIQVNELQPDIQYTLIGIQGGNDPAMGDIYRGLDLFGRVKDLIWAPSVNPSSSSISSSSAVGTNLVRIQHGYDRASDRLWRKDPVAEAASAGLDELYSYDGLYRLKSLRRGTLNSGDDGVNTPTFGQCWTLDATGNWRGFREDDTGSGIWSLVQSRSASLANEILAITNSAGSPWTNPAYDGNGNMTIVPQPADPTVSFTGTYDAWNRLVQLVDAVTGHAVQTNAYDALRRRTVQERYSAGILADTYHRFYSLSWRLIEDRIGTSTDATRQMIWGLRYIDDVVCRDRDTDGDSVLDERLYAMQDPNWNAVAIATAAATVCERYDYTPYGMPAFLTSSYVARSESAYAWDILFTGFLYNADIGLYLARQRVYSPSLGTFIQQDPIGDPASSLYEYASSRPLSFVDPFGLCAQQTAPGNDDDGAESNKKDPATLSKDREVYVEGLREALKESIENQIRILKLQIAILKKRMKACKDGAEKRRLERLLEQAEYELRAAQNRWMRALGEAAQPAGGGNAVLIPLKGLPVGGGSIGADVGGVLGGPGESPREGPTMPGGMVGGTMCVPFGNGGWLMISGGLIVEFNTGERSYYGTDLEIRASFDRGDGASGNRLEA